MVSRKVLLGLVSAAGITLLTGFASASSVTFSNFFDPTSVFAAPAGFSATATFKDIAAAGGKPVVEVDLALANPGSIFIGQFDGNYDGTKLSAYSDAGLTNSIKDNGNTKFIYGADALPGGATFSFDFSDYPTNGATNYTFYLTSTDSGFGASSFDLKDSSNTYFAGMHLQGIAGINSISVFSSTDTPSGGTPPPAAPLPASAWSGMALLGMLGVGSMLRKKFAH